jgi:hypothetical protein
MNCLEFYLLSKNAHMWLEYRLAVYVIHVYIYLRTCIAMHYNAYDYDINRQIHSTHH